MNPLYFSVAIDFITELNGFCIIIYIILLILSLVCALYTALIYFNKLTYIFLYVRWRQLENIAKTHNCILS